MSDQKNKIVIGVAAVLIAGAAVFGFVLSDNNTPTQDAQSQSSQSSQTPPPAPKPKVTQVSYDGVKGKNALELVKQTHKVETKTYEGLGELVTSIDDTAADSKHFWALYVNDQQSQVGAGAYITKSTDKIVWKLEAITP